MLQLEWRTELGPGRRIATLDRQDPLWAFEFRDDDSSFVFPKEGLEVPS